MRNLQPSQDAKAHSQNEPKEAKTSAAQAERMGQHKRRPRFSTNMRPLQSQACSPVTRGRHYCNGTFLD